MVSELNNALGLLDAERKVPCRFLGDAEAPMYFRALYDLDAGTSM